MKGNNTIKLNQSTIVKAVQHYFSTVIFKGDRVPVVKSVKAVSEQRSFGNDDLFEVQVTEPEPKQGPSNEELAS